MATRTNTLTLYDYDPLSREHDSLRLLRLRPAVIGQDSIDCELFEARLHNTDLFEEDLRREDYEAVSWCWGYQPRDCELRIHVGDRAFSFYISCDLGSALRALRFEDKTRLLWVDQICINQGNLLERNQQVPKMNQIYGQAKDVCIWVGESDKSSRRAMDFIKEKVLKLWDFDKLCEDPHMGDSWHAMSMLMKRPWFSRRWVVQEIALAERGILYCGRDQIKWQDFADAVSLFVEAESVTHKLSDVMRKDQKFDQIPDFYGNVRALGAARLVDATSNLFRSSKSGKRERRERLLSLEYLVSKYTVFEARDPRDTIYALLAIASDTTPQAIQQEPPEDFQRLSAYARQRLGRWFRKDFASKRYPVDYDADPVKVYKEFIAFSISKSEPKVALNILCRPWAPRLPGRHHSGVIAPVKAPERAATQAAAASTTILRPPLPSWIPDIGGAAFVMQQHANAAAGDRMDRSNADALVGMPGDRSYSAAGTKPISMNELRWLDRGRYHSMFVHGFVFDTIAKQAEVSRGGFISPKWLELAKWYNTSNDPPEEFWRTLVADRGPNGQSTQPFYPRACKEAMTKRPPDRGVLDTKAVIEHGRCSIIAEFLRRVQAVIWNRRLIRTKALDHLGLVPEDSESGDCLVILYGCAVPVVLRRHQKEADAISKERAEAEVDQRKSDLEKANRVRAAFRGRKKVSMSIWTVCKDPTTIQLVWICALVVFAEYQHNFTLQGATLVNSLIVVLPQPLQKIKQRVSGQSWKEVRGWLLGIRLICACYLITHTAAWIIEPVQRAFLLISLTTLLPLLFLSEAQRQQVVHSYERIVLGKHLEEGDWVRVKTKYLSNGSPITSKPVRQTSGRYSIVKKISPVTVEINMYAELNSMRNVFNVDKLEKVRDYSYFFRGTWIPEGYRKVVQYFGASLEVSPPEPVPEPEECYWQLIGECYIDGMMDGEAIAYQNENRSSIKPQIFELR